MGALDVIAALAIGDQRLRNPVVNCAAVGSPLRGVAYGRLVHQAKRLLPFLTWQPHHYTQLRNMDHRAPAIQMLNAVSTRRRLMQRLHAFWELIGTQDAVVGRNARMRTDGLSVSALKRIVHHTIPGASHTGAAGITQDPRTVLTLIRLMAVPR
jgi:hypothetical protein